MSAITLIESKTLVSSTDGIEFTSIPQDGTDLYVLASVRAANGGTFDNLELTLNGSGSNFSKRFLYGSGSGGGIGFTGSDGHIGYTAANTSTANTFGNHSIYITNYTSSLTKTITTDSVSENNATEAFQSIFANFWNNTAAITSLRVRTNGASMAAGCTISLYKITKGTDGIVVVS